VSRGLWLWFGRARDRRYKLKKILEGEFLPLTMAIKRKSTGPVPGQPKAKAVKSNAKEFNGKKSTAEKGQKVRKEILIQDEEEWDDDDFEGFGDDDGTKDESDMSMEDDQDDLDMSDSEGEEREDEDEEEPKPKKKFDKPPKSGTHPQTLPN
jgi:hypothetical protein